MAKTKRRATSRSTPRGKSKRGRQHWQLDRVTYSDVEAGENVVSASLEELLEAINRQSPDLPWADASRNVLPLIPRLRPYPPGTAEGLRVMAPPGIAIGFGLDFGPGFMNVTAELVRHWSISIAELSAAALRNVHDRASLVQPSEIHLGGREGVETAWLQTNRSVGSTLVLAPTELIRLFGREPRRFITPMRDLIIAFPADADPELVAWYYVEVAAEDPNCLGPVSYLSVDGRVTPEPIAQLVAAFPPGMH